MHLEQFLVGPMAVFAYLIGDPETREAVIIDPGGDEEALVERARERGFKITTIINTHGHADHVCGNQKVQELTGARIVIGRGDVELLSGDRAQYFASLGFTPSPPPDRLVADGEVVTCGRLELQVLATPGHSPGGICLCLADNLFTGDTLFVGSVGRTDLPGSSLDDLLASIGSKILTLPDETIIWPGHRYGPTPSSTIAQERETNPFITDFISG